MRNFDYYNPVKILFGKGKIAEIAKWIPKGMKVMMTYGGGSIKKKRCLRTSDGCVARV